MSEPQAVEKWPLIERKIPLATGVFVLVGGALSLIGWGLNIPRLSDWNNEGIAIKVNPSICLMLGGAGLLIALLFPKLRLLIGVLGAVIAVIAVSTLFEHISGLDLGIDNVIFPEAPGARATMSPGRMGVPASSALTALGVAFILSNLGSKSRKWASILSTAALGISLLSLVGYLFGVNQLYAIPRFTGIALQTASMVAALAFGIAAIVPEAGLFSVAIRRDAGGMVLRRLFLPLILLSLILGWLRIVGQQAGLYDTAFGTAARTLIEMALFLGLLWRTANDISSSENRARSATEALADNEVRLQGVLESLSDAFISIDSDFRFTYANRSVRSLFEEAGRTDDVIGRKVFDVFPEALDTSLGESLIRAMADRTPAELEDYFWPFKRWFHARYFPTDDGGLSLFALDITERREAEQSVRRRAAELAVLYSFADTLNRSLSLAEVYEAALDTIIGALVCDRASILLFDEAGVMKFVASRGLSAEYQEAVTGHSPWRYGETGAKPFGLDNIAESDLEPELKSNIVEEGIEALAFVPLISNGKLIGKFMVYYDQPHTFTADEFEISLTVGNQIAFGVEHKRTEESLRDNEERLRLATQTGKVGVWDWAIRSDHVSWTKAVYTMHGVRSDEFDGKVESFTKLIHPDDMEMVKERIELALSDVKPYEVEFRVVKPDGDVGWLFTNALILRDAMGPYRMIGATIDVTDRKLAEQEFARIAAIVDSSRDAIIGKDLNGVITSWNGGATHIFGYLPDEVIGKSITILIPEERLNEESEILQRLRRGEYTDHFETVRRRKDGTLIDISLTVSPVVNANGKIIGASKIARDITEQRRAEAALRDREIMRRLVDAQEAERHRIARDLHDHLGQQLTALRLKLESIRNQSTGNDKLLRSVSETQEYASRIDMDINYLAWELRPTELDNLGLRDSLASFVREWSKTYGIEADFHTPRTQNGRYSAELETNIYRIVQEALNNILKHAKATRVSVLMEQRDDLIIVIIEDNGKGFVFGERPANGSKSKGLGLIGMRERTALLGGTLEIESRPGEGTTIYARVPIHP